MQSPSNDEKRVHAETNLQKSYIQFGKYFYNKKKYDIASKLFYSANSDTGDVWYIKSEYGLAKKYYKYKKYRDAVGELNKLPDFYKTPSMYALKLKVLYDSYGVRNKGISRAKFSKIKKVYQPTADKFAQAYIEYKQLKAKYPFFQIQGKIREKTGNVILIWGKAFSSGDVYGEGVLNEDGNIQVINFYKSNITGNFYIGRHYFIKKTYGKNNYGMPTAVYVYGDPPDELQSGKEKFRATYKQYEKKRLKYIASLLELKSNPRSNRIKEIAQTKVDFFRYCLKKLRRYKNIAVNRRIKAIDKIGSKYEEQNGQYIFPDLGIIINTSLEGQRSSPKEIISGITYILDSKVLKEYFDSEIKKSYAIDFPTDVPLLDIENYQTVTYPDFLKRAYEEAIKISKTDLSNENEYKRAQEVLLNLLKVFYLDIYKANLNMEEKYFLQKWGVSAKNSNEVPNKYFLKLLKLEKILENSMVHEIWGTRVKMDKEYEKYFLKALNAFANDFSESNEDNLLKLFYKYYDFYTTGVNDGYFQQIKNENSFNRLYKNLESIVEDDQTIEESKGELIRLAVRFLPETVKGIMRFKGKTDKIELNEVKETNNYFYPELRQAIISYKNVRYKVLFRLSAGNYDIFAITVYKYLNEDTPFDISMVDRR